MCCFIDSVWSRCTPRKVMVVWKGMQLPPISADSQQTELIRTDGSSSQIFSVLTSVCCFASVTKYRLYRTECWTEKK